MFRRVQRECISLDKPNSVPLGEGLEVRELRIATD
jgi:hypothetical protein